MRDDGRGWPPHIAAPTLVERARTSRAAFGELYDLYVDGVYRFCLAHTGTAERAAELTEETFLRALQAITRPSGQPGRYEGAGPDVSSWLLCVAAGALCDTRHGDLTLLNREGVMPGDDSPEGVSGESLVDRRHVDPEALVGDWEWSARLLAGLALLPATYQQVLRLRYWEGCGWTEVAGRMGQAEGAVRRLGKTALWKLAILLGEVQRRRRGDISIMVEDWDNDPLATVIADYARGKDHDAN